MTGGQKDLAQRGVATCFFRGTESTCLNTPSMRLLRSCRTMQAVFIGLLLALGVGALPERPLGGAGVAFVAFASPDRVAACVMAVVTARDLALVEGADARAFIVGIHGRWTFEEKRLMYKQGVNVLTMDPRDPALSRMQNHPRQRVGEWRMEQYFWLFVPRLLDHRWGVRYAVLIDCDARATDARILQVLPRVVGIGAVALEHRRCSDRMHPADLETMKRKIPAPHRVVDAFRASGGVIVMNLEALTQLRWAELGLKTFLDLRYTMMEGGHDLLNMCVRHSGARAIALQSRFNVLVVAPSWPRC
jgi:hypothetical protein